MQNKFMTEETQAYNQVNAPSVATSDENLSFQQLYYKSSLPSLAKRIFFNAPIHGPTGAIFGIKGKNTKDGFEIIRNEVEVFPDMLEKQVSISGEALDDIKNMYGKDGLEILATYINGFVNKYENEKTIEFLEKHAKSSTTLTLTEPNSSKQTLREISMKCSELILEANSTGKLTYKAFVILPYKYAAAVIAEYADLSTPTVAIIDDLFVGSNGQMNFYINPNPSADTVYIGLADDNTGTSCATYSDYFNEIRTAISDSTGMMKYFIYAKFALTPSPLHTENTPMMFKFTIK